MEIPCHVAIIMDGNGRWATARGLSHTEGHWRGAEALRKTVRAASEIGIKVLTVYAFSTENWERPKDEVSGLMWLVRRYFRENLAELCDSGVRIRVIGDRHDERIDNELRSFIAEAETRTKNNERLTLAVAFNYGGRDEIIRAARRIAEQAAAGTLDPKKIDTVLFAKHLDTTGFSDPDLIIRTGGEQRLSNFLLWQSAYAEFVTLDIHWPDFDRAALEWALTEYSRRERRFGGLVPRRAATV